MNKTSRQLLNAILSKDEKTIRESFKSTSMGLVEGVRQVATEELWDSKRPLPEATETITSELKAIQKARTLPEPEMEVEEFTDPYSAIVSCVEEDHEVEISFGDGEAFTITPTEAYKLLGSVTEDELTEAAKSYETFVELVHAALDEEVEVEEEETDNE